MTRAAVAWFGVFSVTAMALAGGPSQPPTASQNVVSLEATLTTELLAFCEATTLGAWRRVRPQDAVTPYEPWSRGIPRVSGPDATPAVIATARLDVAGVRRLTRHVFFYDPLGALSPPAADVTATTLADQAAAGYLWIEAESADPHSAQRLAFDALAAFDRVLGPGDGSAEVSAHGAARWRDTRVWRHGAATVAAGWTPGGTSSPDPPRVIVIASLPPSADRLVFVRRGRDRLERDDRAGRSSRISAERTARTRARVKEAIDLAAVGGTVEATMRALVPYVTADLFTEPLPDGDPSVLYRTMREWMLRTATLPAPRRAAALVVADQILQGTVHPFRLAVYEGPGRAQSTARREAFVRLGATFRELPLGATFAYTNPWLKQAYTLDPEGRAGELAFLILLDKGFETSGVCSDQHGEGFQQVISRGESFLATSRGRVSSDRTSVLFAVAQAHSDIVALATGHGYGGPGGDEATKFGSRAQDARREALRYYRLALAVETGTERAKDAVVEVWRLAAGLSPTRTYFYCVYD